MNDPRMLPHVIEQTSSLLKSTTNTVPADKRTDRLIIHFFESGLLASGGFAWGILTSGLVQFQFSRIWPIAVAAFLVTWGAFLENDFAELIQERTVGKRARYVGLAAHSVSLLGLLVCINGGIASFVAGGIVVVAGLLYSHPTSYGKRFLGIATLLHIIGAGALVYLGASTLSISFNSVAVPALYFALIQAGGHFNHEAMDSDYDRRCGVDTLAVRCGERISALASTSCFMIAQVLLLVGRGREQAMWFPAVILLSLHALLFMYLRSGEFKTVAFKMVRRTYRVAYLILYLLWAGWILL